MEKEIDSSNAWIK